MKDIFLLGAFAETVELCELCGYHIIGMFDMAVKGELCGYPVLGDDSVAEEYHKRYPDVPIVIAPDKPAARKRLFKKYREIGFKIETVISPKAFVSPSAKLGEGCIVSSFCNISTNCSLGEGVKLNTFANVMHDARIADYVTIAPNAVILGYITIGEGAYIGANSTILQTHSVGENSTVGAGAVVTKDVVPGEIVVGVPARRMRGKKE